MRASSWQLTLDGVVVGGGVAGAPLPSVASGNHAVVGGDHVGAGDVARLVVGAAYVQRELHGAVGAKLLAVAVLGVAGRSRGGHV